MVSREEKGTKVRIEKSLIWLDQKTTVPFEESPEQFQGSHGSFERGGSHYHLRRPLLSLRSMQCSRMRAILWCLSFPCPADGALALSATHRLNDNSARPFLEKARTGREEQLWAVIDRLASTPIMGVTSTPTRSDFLATKRWHLTIPYPCYRLLFLPRASIRGFNPDSNETEAMCQNNDGTLNPNRRDAERRKNLIGSLTTQEPLSSFVQVHNLAVVLVVGWHCSKRKECHHTC